MANQKLVEIIVRVKDAVARSGVKKIDGDINKLKKNVGEVNNRMDTLRTKLQNLRNTSLVGGALGASMGFLLNKMAVSATDFAETQSKFNTVFDGIQSKATETAESLAKDFNMSRIDALSLLGNTGDILAGVGFDKNKALDMSNKIQQISADLASFNNVKEGALPVSEAITKALLGERESLKTYGVAIQEEMVKKEVAILVSKGMVFASEQEAKALATLNIVYRQSPNAIGDVERTKNSLANRTLALKNKMADLSIELGNHLLPLKAKLVEALIKVIGWFNDLSPSGQRLTVIIAGVTAGMLVLLPILLGVGLAVTMISAPVLIAVGAFVALGAAFSAIISYWDKLKEMFSGIGEFFTNTWGNVKDFFSGLPDMGGSGNGAFKFEKYENLAVKSQVVNPATQQKQDLNVNLYDKTRSGVSAEELPKAEAINAINPMLSY